MGIVRKGSYIRFCNDKGQCGPWRYVGSRPGPRRGRSGANWDGTLTPDFSIRSLDQNGNSYNTYVNPDRNFNQASGEYYTQDLDQNGASVLNYEGDEDKTIWVKGEELLDGEREIQTEVNFELNSLLMMGFLMIIIWTIIFMIQAQIKKG